MLMPMGIRGQRSGIAQTLQPLRNHLRAVVVEAESIDERFLLRKTKDARPRISGLRFGRNRSDLGKTETERGPCRQGHAALVESCRKSDRIRKRDAKYCRRLRFRLKLTQRQVSSAGAQNTQRKMMRRLRIEREEQWPNESFVGAAALHLPMQNWLKTEASTSSVSTAANHFADRIDARR